MKIDRYDAVFVMGSIHRVLKAEKVLIGAGIPVDTLVTPREISADCGMVVALPAQEVENALAVLSSAGASPTETWKLDNGKFSRFTGARPGESSA